MAARPREDLHRLIDELPERDVPTVRRMLRALAPSPLRKFLAAAPIDDEPLTPEEKAEIREAEGAYRRGEWVSDEDLDRELSR